MKASEERAWSKGAAKVTRRDDLGCASSQTRNPALKSKMILSHARLTQTFLYVGSLACCLPPPPQTTRNSVMEARQKNITRTLPHVNRTLTEPAAGGCRPRAVTASAHPSTTPPHWQCIPAAPLPRAVTASAHPHTDTLPAHIHCTATLALSLPARTRWTNTPPHRQCVHANQRPHASGDQAAYSAWPSNHAVQQDMHSANGQDADYRGRLLTAQSMHWYTMARSLL